MTFKETIQKQHNISKNLYLTDRTAKKKNLRNSCEGSSYGGPQLSHQQQITHSYNKLIATTTKTSHQNQIAHSTNKMLTAQTKTLTAQTKTLTAQTKTLTAPPNRGGLSCLFLDLKKDGITWPWQVKIFAEVLDFLTRICLENVWDSGEGENRVDSRCIQ